MYQQFQHIQEEYYKLRGQYSVGRLSAQDFDAALQAMTVQDAQGRLWMIGANTGTWYYTDGGSWLPGNPFQVETVDATAERVGPSAVEPTDPDGTDGLSGRGLALPFLATSVILMIVAGIAFFFFNSPPVDGIASADLPTRIVPPTSVALLPTAPATRTPTRTATARATDAKGTTPIPITLTPAALELEPTDPAPALTVIPTITRGAPSGNPSDSDGAFEDTVFTPAEPNPVLNSSLPPDVYVTGIRVSPNPPPQRQPITFTASFLNTNPNSVGLEWRIVMFDPAKQGRNKDWGESQLVGITIPPGRSEFFLSYTPVTSSGPCIPLQATVARSLDDNGRFLLPGVNGSPHFINLTFC